MSFFGFPRGRNKALNTVRLVLLNGNTTSNAILYYDSGYGNGQSGGTGTVVTWYPGTFLPIYATGGTGTATSTASVVNYLEIFDSTGFTSRWATGASGSQVDLLLDLPGGNGGVPKFIAAGTLLWVQPVTAAVFVSGASAQAEMSINFYD
jgi:hypothetical protein